MSTKTVKKKALTVQKESRIDGWKNILTGLGYTKRDKRVSADVHWEPLSELTLENWYASDDIAQLAVDQVPYEMLRQGYDLKDVTDPEFDKKVQNYLRSYELDQKLQLAMSWARLYGGAVMIFGINDGQDPDKPVNLNSIKSVDFVHVLDRYQLHVDQMQMDPRLPGYGEPIMYSIHVAGTDQSTLTGARIHASRCITFHGAILPKRLRTGNSNWHDSVLTKLWDIIRDFNTAHSSIASVVQDFSQPIFKIKHLTDLVAAGKDGIVSKRIGLANVTRSMLSAVVIDSEEEFSRDGATVTGLPDLMKLVNMRLATAMRMPQTKLFGDSPSGLNSTGKGELKDWYDFIANQQENVLKPRHMRAIELLLLSKASPLKGILPKEWSLEYRPLEQMSEAETAELRFKQSQTDKNYVEAGVLDPSEVAVSRFGGDGYSLDTTIDLELRTRARDEEDNRDQGGSEEGNEPTGDSVEA